MTFQGLGGKSSKRPTHKVKDRGGGEKKTTGAIYVWETGGKSTLSSEVGRRDTKDLEKKKEGGGCVGF